MKTSEEIRRLVRDLGDHVWAASSLASALELGLAESLEVPRDAEELAARHGISPQLAVALADVLVALGVAERDQNRYQASAGIRPFLLGGGQPAGRLMAVELRAALLQGIQLERAAARGQLRTGWRHDDSELLDALGQFSAGAVELIRALVPHLEGLADRLQKADAVVLDVGAGVGALTLALARALPDARVVAIEPAAEALAQALRNVEASGLGARIELRQTTLQNLAEDGRYDLAWLPQMFLADEALEPGLRALLRALRPGGWLVTTAVCAHGDSLTAAASRLRTVLWGGGARDADDLIGALEAHGLCDVQAVAAGGPDDVTVPIVARRPE
jgi:predicted O-methyltransferase YrrM